MTEKQLKRYSARARRRRRLRRLTLLMLVLAAAFLLIDRNFRPLVFSLAEARSAAPQVFGVSAFRYSVKRSPSAVFSLKCSS